MDNRKINKEERMLLKEFESDQFKKVRGVQKEKERYQQCAKNFK